MQQVFNDIESEGFRAHVNLASDYHVFSRLVFETEAARRLSQLLDEAGNRKLLLDRIHQLTGTEVDDRFENPWDAALATYVLVMFRKHMLFGQLAVVAARRARQKWWLAQTLARLPSGSQYPSSAEGSSGPEPEREPARVASNASDSVLAPDPFARVCISALVKPHSYPRKVMSVPA